jgi:hypothetical protein
MEKLEEEGFGREPGEQPPKFEAALKSNVCCALLSIDRHLRVMLSCLFIPTGKNIYSYEIEANG